MPIVPVFRLRASPDVPFRRYRFSRDAQPNPNPLPGRDNPDRDSVWAVDRVAFYAWSDPTHADMINHQLIPVYELYRLGGDNHVYYRYSVDAEADGEGWISRDYVAFWMYPDGAANAGAPVYIYSHATDDGTNYALSLEPDPSQFDPCSASLRWGNMTTLGLAAGTIPVAVSVRRDPRRDDTFFWSYTPSTINVVYASTLELVQAAGSAWRFTDLEIVNGDEDFDEPTVTDARVSVNASYTNPGRDFKYRLTIDLFGGPDQLISDGGDDADSVESPYTKRKRRKVGMGPTVNDPEIVNPPPDRI